MWMYECFMCHASCIGKSPGKKRRICVFFCCAHMERRKLNVAKLCILHRGTYTISTKCVCIYIPYKWNRSNLVSRECLFLVGCRRLPLYGLALKHISIILLVYFVSIDSKFKTTRNILGKRKNQTAAKAQVHICISQKWLCCWCRLNIDNIPNHYTLTTYHSTTFSPLFSF